MRARLQAKYLTGEKEMARRSHNIARQCGERAAALLPSNGLLEKCPVFGLLLSRTELRG